MFDTRGPTPSTQLSSFSIITTTLLQNINYNIPCLMFPVIVVFVKKSTRLYSPGIHHTLNVPESWAYLTLWQHIALCILFQTDAGTLDFVTTDLFSWQTYSGTSRFTPSVISLYISASTVNGTETYAFLQFCIWPRLFHLIIWYQVVQDSNIPYHYIQSFSGL